MEMSGQQLIPAAKEAVWAALNDVDVLRVCIPGCQELTKTSETEMSAVAVMKVGPVKARFQGAVTLSDLDPPHGYRITGEGQGGVAGFAKGVATVRLEAADGGTVLGYTVDAQIGGKLSQLGGRLIDVTAKQMAGQFFKKFAEEIEARQNPIMPGDQRSESSRPTLSQHAGEPLAARPQAHGTSVSRSSIAAATTGSAAGVSLPLVALVVFVSALAAMWAVHGGLLPALAPAGNAPGRLSADLASLIQVVMAAAVGYLFGARSR